MCEGARVLRRRGIFEETKRNANAAGRYCALIRASEGLFTRRGEAAKGVMVLDFAPAVVIMRLSERKARREEERRFFSSGMHDFLF